MYESGTDIEEFTCQICGKGITNKFNLRRHMKLKHPRERVDPTKIIVSNEKIEYLPTKTIKCPKCEFIMPHEDHIEKHMEMNHQGKSYKYKCFSCLKPFYSNSELKNHINLMHTSRKEDRTESFSTMVNDTDFDPFIFEHPFSMIVAGPSRCGKTYWVINLLLNANERIKPAPKTIVYCYSHWQSKYDMLKENMDQVQWHKGMPTKSYLDEITNAIVVLDDLMSESVNDKTLMSIFTKQSHHQNISVILLMQNLFHQGKESRSISTNTQFLVLFKNPRDRQQIKTLALQMHPKNWRGFLEKFEYETSKPYGKVIIDFRPSTSDENRIVKFTDSQDFFQQVRKQQLTAANPYFAKAIDEKMHMDAILNDSTLDNSKKEIEYEQAINNYSAYMKKAEPQQLFATAAFPMTNNVRRPLFFNTKSASGQKSSSTITRPRQFPVPDGEGEWGTMQDILSIPYEPEEEEEFKANLKNILDLPPLADQHYANDSGDDDHMENFISLSDDEETVKEKNARAEYNFRKRVAKKGKKQQTLNKKPYEKKHRDYRR